MDPNHLHDKYLRKGTGGYGILKKFFMSYYDVLSKSDHSTFDDFLNGIYLNLVKIDLVKIEKEENYIYRSIKIQCWAALDKAIKKRSRIVPEREVLENNGKNSLEERPATNARNPLQILESREFMTLFIRFRSTLDREESEIVNALIDRPDESLADLAKRRNLNENTVRTKVRRIRLAFTDYLKHHGYDTMDR